ncbi:hypothetical protein Avbf_11058 [Armadillidium vulgare]|nr:hypothetical protein Avbf_11058 [Armadillidium vulgare]
MVQTILITVLELVTGCQWDVMDGAALRRGRAVDEMVFLFFPEPKGHHSTGQGKDRPSLFEGMQKYLEGNQIPEPNIQNIWCCFGKNLTVVDENNIIVDKEIEIKLRDFYSDDPEVVNIMVSNIGTCKSELTQQNTCNLNIFHDCLERMHCSSKRTIACRHRLLRLREYKKRRNIILI